MTVTIIAPGVKNGLGRTIKPGTMIDVPETRAIELIGLKQAEASGFDLRKHYQTKLQLIKSAKDIADVKDNEPTPGWWTRLKNTITNFFK